MQGIVVEYDASTKFGAIQCHSLGGLVAIRPSSAVEDEKVERGDMVSFELGRPEGIPQAIDVRVIARGFDPSSPPVAAPSVSPFKAASSNGPPVLRPTAAPGPSPSKPAEMKSPHLLMASRFPAPPPYASPAPPVRPAEPVEPVAAPTAPKPSKRRDDREDCASCGKRMVPRLVTHHGTPTRSFCPFCGGLHRDFTPPVPDTKPGFDLEFYFYSGLITLVVYALCAIIFS